MKPLYESFLDRFRKDKLKNSTNIKTFLNSYIFPYIETDYIKKSIKDHLGSTPLNKISLIEKTWNKHQEKFKEISKKLETLGYYDLPFSNFNEKLFSDIEKLNTKFLNSIIIVENEFEKMFKDFESIENVLNDLISEKYGKPQKQITEINNTKDIKIQYAKRIIESFERFNKLNEAKKEENSYTSTMTLSDKSIKDAKMISKEVVNKGKELEVKVKASKCEEKTCILTMTGDFMKIKELLKCLKGRKDIKSVKEEK